MTAGALGEQLQPQRPAPVPRQGLRLGAEGGTAQAREIPRILMRLRLKAGMLPTTIHATTNEYKVRPMLSDPLIEIQNQILGEAVSLAGTEFHLHYRSDRVIGRRAAYSTRIPLSGTDLPADLKSIVLEIDVAGQHFRQRFPPASGDSYLFTWNGQDASGDIVQGKQLTMIRLGYVYNASYPRPEVTRWLERSTILGTWDSRVLCLGGWSLNVHHAYDPGGRALYLGDGRRRGNLTVDGRPAGEILLLADDGRQVYVFDRIGRHLRTVNALTGTPVYEFEYDATGRLTAIEDGDGNITRIERNGEGNSAVVVAPYGQRTKLRNNVEGYLASINNATGETAQFGYTNSGLLVSCTTPTGSTHRFSYDEAGRLVRHEDPAGGLSQMARSSIGNGFQVVLLTALNRESTYLVEVLSTGEQRRVNKCCGGGQMVALVGMNGARTITYPDGTVALFEQQPAPGSSSVLSISKRSVFTTPRGLTRVVSRARSATPGNSVNPLDVATLTDTVDVNTRTYTTTFDASTRQSVSTTPGKRQILTSWDAQGRMTGEQVGDLLPLRLTYDGRGRIVEVTQGLEADARRWTISHDTQGRVASVTDPLKRTVRFQYDAAGRVIKRISPDGRETSYGYDPNGNRTSLTPPDRPAHAFARTPVNLITEYIPPGTGEGGRGTGYTYNSHRQLTRVTRPDGVTIDLGYDAAGAPSSVTFPDGQVRIVYDPASRNLTTVSTPDGTVTSHAYDGALLTSATWTGTIKGTVNRTYDNDFRVASRAVNGASPVDYKYDADGLWVQAGALIVSRDAQNGLVKGTRLGDLTTAPDHNGFGEIVAFSAAHRERELVAFRYTRDGSGRIVEKTETIDGQTARYAYEYDPAGRLAGVTKNGVRISRYAYDGNGNRVMYTGPNGAVSGTYDAQDRLTQYGSALYRHTANGEWSQKTADGKTSGYHYDVFGNLKTVALPNGTKIEYLTDGEHRRIGKKVNGTLVQGFLYQDRLRPIAELDAQNTLVSLFIYSPGENAPAYALRGDGTVHRIILDHLGSPRLVVDVASGDVIQRMDYDEYGNVLLDTNPGCQPFGFAGGIYDRDSGLTRFGARDYDPETGRWTAKDPLLFAGGTNLYEYALSDPVNLVDPNGLWTGIWPGMGPRWHHDRNVNQSCPPTSPPLYDGPSECPMEQTSTGWGHEGRSPTHGGYHSYRHSDLGYQCVYDDYGNLLTDPENEGTYDYFPPYNPDGSVSVTGVPAHFLFDVLPWVFWGNAR